MRRPRTTNTIVIRGDSAKAKTVSRLLGREAIGEAFRLTRAEARPERVIPRTGETTDRGPRRAPDPADFADTCLPKEGYHVEGCRHR